MYAFHSHIFFITFICFNLFSFFSFKWFCSIFIFNLLYVMALKQWHHFKLPNTHILRKWKLKVKKNERKKKPKESRKRDFNGKAAYWVMSMASDWQNKWDTKKIFNQTKYDKKRKQKKKSDEVIAYKTSNEPMILLCSW